MVKLEGLAASSRRTQFFMASSYAKARRCKSASSNQLRNLIRCRILRERISRSKVRRVRGGP
jgi:hypothetical protein